MRQSLAASSERKMAMVHVFLLEAVLISSMIGHSGARRPQIAAEELFKNPALYENSGADAAAVRAGGPGRAPLQVAVGAPSCYFNRDCRAREFCVKPDGGAFTPGVCSVLSDMTPVGSADHSSDLHFLVRAPRGSRVRRSVAAAFPAGETTGKTDLLQQLLLLRKGDRLARALANYVHAKYPISWEQDSGKDEQGRPRRGGKSSAVESRDADQPGEPMDPDLKAIIEKGSHREMQSAEMAPSPTSSLGPQQQQHPVVVVKENDMASGPKRHRMKGANHLR